MFMFYSFFFFLFYFFFFFFFFFSSRRRHTRYIGDWSSDVCSSDLDRSITCGQWTFSGSHTSFSKSHLGMPGHSRVFAASACPHRRRNRQRFCRSCQLRPKRSERRKRPSSLSPITTKSPLRVSRFFSITTILAPGS